jgi:tRNA threonylcarbamoyladenosine biosynthesis protein TsaB
MRPEPSVPLAPPRLLAFDTSTETMAIAACGPAGETAWSGDGGAAASATLLPQARRLMQQAGLDWPDLDAVAFGAGPGAFTGLRTACAVAQGLAFGLGRPVLPLDSLALVAEDAGWRDGPVWVAMDARMDEVYAAAYRWDPGGWQALQAPALYTLAALAECWLALPPLRIAGSALAAFEGRLPVGSARLQPGVDDRAAALLRLARQAWARGEAIDPAQALPTYVRDKVAQTSAERLAARADRMALGPAGARR